MDVKGALMQASAIIRTQGLCKGLLGTASAPGTIDPTGPVCIVGAINKATTGQIGSIADGWDNLRVRAVTEFAEWLGSRGDDVWSHSWFIAEWSDREDQTAESAARALAECAEGIPRDGAVVLLVPDYQSGHRTIAEYADRVPDLMGCRIIPTASTALWLKSLSALNVRRVYVAPDAACGSHYREALAKARIQMCWNGGLGLREGGVTYLSAL